MCSSDVRILIFSRILMHFHAIIYEFSLRVPAASLDGPKVVVSWVSKIHIIDREKGSICVRWSRTLHKTNKSYNFEVRLPKVLQIFSSRRLTAVG